MELGEFHRASYARPRRLPTRAACLAHLGVELVRREQLLLGEAEQRREEPRAGGWEGNEAEVPAERVGGRKRDSEGHVPDGAAKERVEEGVLRQRQHKP